MNQWAFVIAAYALVVGATIALSFASAISMRRAEKAAEAVRNRR